MEGMVLVTVVSEMNMSMITMALGDIMEAATMAHMAIMTDLIHINQSTKVIHIHNGQNHMSYHYFIMILPDASESRAMDYSICLINFQTNTTRTNTGERLMVTAAIRNMIEAAYGLLPLTTLPPIPVIMDHHLVPRPMITMMMMITMIQSAIG